MQVEQENETAMECDECDCELHSMIQERINQNFFPSLQALTATFILDNFELFSGSNLLSIKRLSNHIQQRLLQQLEVRNMIKMKRQMLIHKSAKCLFKSDILTRNYLKLVELVDEQYFHMIFATFRQLVGVKCQEFNLDWLLVFCPVPYKYAFGVEVLDILASEAPHLESLVVSYEPLWDELFGQSQHQTWRASGFRLRLFALSSLKSLKIPGHRLLPEDLILIGQQLPHLELLHCNIFCDQDKFGQLLDATAKMIGKLENFKHFIFNAEMAMIQQTLNYYRFCIMYFPQLHTIGLNDEAFIHAEKRQLRRLLLSGETELHVLQSIICNNLMPNIRHLLLKLHPKEKWDAKRYNLATSFPEIRELTLQGVGNEREFLRAYGPNLFTLTIGHHFDNDTLDLPLEELVELCPKLEELHIRFCTDRAPIPNPDEHHTLLSLLRMELEGELPYPISSLFMIAPNIKRVAFQATRPTKDEVTHLIELIKEKKVCQKLVSLDVFLGWDYEDEDPKNFLELFMAFSELVKVMCAYVPTLEEVSFGMYVQEYDFFEDEDYKFVLSIINDSCVRKCLEAVDAVHSKYRLRHEL